MEMINNTVMVGSLESGDAQIVISPPADDAVEIELNSSVKVQFGASILATVHAVLAEWKVAAAHVVVNDKGAVDAVIRARTEAALARAQGRRFDWSRLDGRTGDPRAAAAREDDR